MMYEAGASILVYTWYTPRVYGIRLDVLVYDVLSVAFGKCFVFFTMDLAWFT